MLYGTPADASTYLSDRGFPVPEGLDALLLRASEALDAAYTFRGRRTDSAQTRAWPRSGVTTGEGDAVDPDTVPTAVEHATYALARLIGLNSEALSAAVSAPVASVKAGSVAVQFSEAVAVSARSLSRDPQVFDLLRGYIAVTLSQANIRLRKS